MSRIQITTARAVLALLWVTCLQNGRMVMVMGQSYGGYGGGQQFQQSQSQSHPQPTNAFGYNSFPNFKFSPYNAPGFPALAAPAPPPPPPPPPPPAFGYRSAPPPPPGLGKPFCESLQYLESEKSCQIPDSLFPVKGSCTEHLRCFRYRTGRIKPLPWKCPVGEIFSTISNQCEDVRKQDTFKEDYCPQIYCDDGAPGAGLTPKPKPTRPSGTESPSYVFPIVPENKPGLKTLPPCPPPDDFLEFGPVQKCQPKGQGYGGYSNSNRLPPLYEAPTTQYPPQTWPVVDEKYVGQNHVYQNEDAGVKYRPGGGQRIPLLPLDEQNPYLKPTTEGPPTPFTPAKVPHHPHKPVHPGADGGVGGHKEKEHEPTPLPSPHEPQPPGAQGGEEYTDYDEPERGAARVPNRRNSAPSILRLSLCFNLGLITTLFAVILSFILF